MRPRRPERQRVGGRPASSGSGAATESLPDAASLDLSRDSQETRRALYLLAVAEYWSLRGEVDEYEIPAFTPQDAKLAILYFCRRYAEPRIMPSRFSVFAVTH